MNRVDLSRYSNSWYKPGGFVKRAAWYFVDIVIFRSSLPYPYWFKALVLRLFGAKVGTGAVIKPRVGIKYPWFLEIGDNVWIGEEVRIDNLAWVRIGSNVCISQGAYLLTGNHNYNKDTFDLMVSPVVVESGAWIGARATVCPGVTIATHSVITAGSVVTKSTLPFTICQGVPAKQVRERVIGTG